ncbi:ABC transporter ATP-binding protein [Candidatus Poriferisocius sp.]|uniref:ABC transporter ATP-binding protein n=1 Tax=Candidatus Poriferisocius sp. TaxID=3101276 RepID=UPI003B01FEB8
MKVQGASAVLEAPSPPAVPTDGPLLAVEGVTVRFGGVVAVDDVTMSVLPGQIRGLIGPNGAGKTTLFDSITGVNIPTAGSIRLEGKELSGRPATWRARRGIRRTFQRQQPFGWLSVADNVLTALEWEGGGGGIAADLLALPSRRRVEARRRRRVDEVLELCGLVDIRDTPAGELPIARARMVELARAVVSRPKLLLLDEPTSGIEHEEAAQLGGIIQTIRAEDRCSVLLVEHDVAFVMSQCDRITVLNLGRVIGEGSPEEVRSNPAVRDAYLG